MRPIFVEYTSDDKIVNATEFPKLIRENKFIMKHSNNQLLISWTTMEKKNPA